MTLSGFLQRLLFVNQFSINEGKVEILGTNYILLDASYILALQDIDKTKMYQTAKYASIENVKNLVEHAEVYKNIKDQSLKNIAELSRKIGKTDEGTIKTLQMIFDIYGLGKMQILDLNNDKKTAIVQIQNSSIAIEQYKKGRTTIPKCTLTAGMLAGLFSFIFGKDVNCNENKCFAKGDEACFFNIA